MGMTIDEAHGILSNGLVNAPSEHEWCMAFKVALDTMKKYQKIEQTLHNGFGKGVYAVFDEIVKVVEDGKID